MNFAPIIDYHHNRKSATRFRMIALLAAGLTLGFGPTLRRNHSTMSTVANRPQIVVQRITATNTPTRSLFAYYRDDHTHDHLTTVQIDAVQAAHAAIDPNVFGNFIEHLGGVVYEGIWAQALLNPNLERIEERDSAPPAWRCGERTAWIEEGYHSPHSVRLLPPPSNSPISQSTDGAGQSDASLPQRPTPNAQHPAHPAASLSQTVRLPLRRIRSYHVSGAARALHNKGLIVAGLVDRTGTVQAETKQWVATADWERFRLALTLPAQALNAGPELEFRVWLQEGGPVDVDQIELFPDDSVNGVDPDVLKRTQEWHPPLLRWPGGNFASGYHWQDGIGPHDRRPTRRNAAWGGIEPNHFGTHEFMDFCRRVGSQPQLTVNAGDGAPEEAAAWVRYCNAPAGDRYGKMRAANGATSPFNVRIWEVGNELYGGWQIGHTDPAGNAARYVRFRDAMLAADPNLRLIATGKADEFTPDGMQRDFAWNRALLEATVANGGQAPDWLSIHPLVPLPAYAGNATYEEQYESAMAHPQFLGDTLLPELSDLIHQAAGPQARTHIAITEWGIIVGGERWRQSPNHDSLAGAIFNALTLNAILRNSDQVTLANMTALMHGGGIKKWNGVTYVDPQYYTQQLYTLAQPHTPVRTTTTGPGSDVPARGQMPAVKDVPDVDVFSALTKDGKMLKVFAVNRHLKETRPLRLEWRNFPAQSASATLLTAPDPRDGNGWDHPNSVRPVPFALPAAPPHSDHPWQVTLPPHSLVVFTLRRS
jgi:alpha-N-arabinofuranosidase